MDRGKIITVDSWIFNWDFWLIMYWDNFFVFYSESSNHKFMLEFNILVWNSNFELPLLWFLLRIMFGHYFGCSHLPGTPLNPPWNLAESWFHVSFCGHWPYLFSNNNRLVVPGLMLVHLQPIPNAEHHFSRFWRLDHCRMAEQLLPYQGAKQGPISGSCSQAAQGRLPAISPCLPAGPGRLSDLVGSLTVQGPVAGLLRSSGSRPAGLAATQNLQCHDDGPSQLVDFPNDPKC